MPINSFKEDERTVEQGKMKTLLRLFSYLLAYKKEILLVLFIMLFRSEEHTSELQSH